MNNKRISIAIATYNGERFLREQLDSLYSQTRLADEVVVSDDGSTDGTIRILEEYRQRYGLQYSIHSEQQGVNGNFMHAIAMTTGDYICICDQDDIWKTNKIAMLEKAMEQQKQDMPVAIASMREDIDSAGQPIAGCEKAKYSSGFLATAMTLNRSQGCTMMLNRQLATRVLEIYTQEEKAKKLLYDVLISMVAAIEGEKVNLPDQLMYYRHHENNTIDCYTRKRKSMAKRIQQMRRYYPFLANYRIHELAIINQVYNNHSIDTSKKVFLERMSALDNLSSLWDGLRIIQQMPELSWVKKMEITVLSPCVGIAKRIINLV